MTDLARKHLPGWTGPLLCPLMLAALLVGQRAALAKPLEWAGQDAAEQSESATNKPGKPAVTDSADAVEGDTETAAPTRTITVLTPKAGSQKPAPLADVQVRVAGSGASPEETGSTGTVQLPIANDTAAILHLFVTGMPTCKLTLPALAANELAVRILVEFVVSNDKKICKVSRLG